MRIDNTKIENLDLAEIDYYLEILQKARDEKWKKYMQKAWEDKIKGIVEEAIKAGCRVTIYDSSSYGDGEELSLEFDSVSDFGIEVEIKKP